MNPEKQLTLYSTIDFMNKDCEKCGEGYYKETSIHDDWDGVLHCSKCNHEVKRHKEIWCHFHNWHTHHHKLPKYPVQLQGNQPNTSSGSFSILP